jgi:hypothetical protein
MQRSDTVLAQVMVAFGFCRSKPICYGGRSRDERCNE